jgi:Protein of unknown function (DUF4242)
VTHLTVGCQQVSSLEDEQRKQQTPKETNIMAKFMCTHTIPPGKFSADQLRQFAQAAQHDPTVKGYRSFANLAEGKAVCIMEAPGKDAVAAWFAKMGMPVDSITKVELEGERGNIQSA